MENRVRLLSVLGTALFVVFVIVGYVFKWDWTGFTGHDGSAKTLWDWLQLLGILAIPAVIGIGLRVFTIAYVQACEAESMDRQREETLQAYRDKMLELLLVSGLRHSTESDEVRKIARVRTLTVLRSLDADRKSSVLQFLQEADLMNNDDRILELEGVDLSGAKLSGIKLSEGRLSNANLSGANLNGAKMDSADLCSAKLSGAYLNDADLSGANLSGADLNDANLGWVILSGPAQNQIFLGPSNLSEANLSRASLCRANLRGANLREANLSETNLSGANLSGANLTGAKLDGAELREAEGVTDEQLGKATSLEGMIMPDGSKRS